MALGTRNLFPDFTFDVAISYAREDGALVDGFARFLNAKGVRVYQDTLDHIVEATIGRDLAVELPRIYSREAAFCIIFISQYYRGEYVRTELRAALRRLIETEDYILPVRLDDTIVEDLPKTIVYLDARPGGRFEDRERLFKTMLGAIHTRAGIDRKAVRQQSESGQPSGTIPCDYFDVILPAMLKWKGDAAASLDKTLRFIVTGRDGGTWTLQLKQPLATVVAGTEGVPDLTIKITSAEMMKMLAGNFDARQALIEGNVELMGDLTVLETVGGLFQPGGGLQASEMMEDGGQRPQQPGEVR